MPDTTEITPEIQALIDAAIAKEVTGLKTKNSELIQTNKSLKADLDGLKSQFEGFDIEAVKGLLTKASKDDETKLIAEGKIDEVLSKRLERMKADYDKKLADALTASEAATKRAQAFQGRVLDDAIRAAAAKAGLHQHAIDDALFRARSMFSLDENGNAVQLGDDGRPVLGKDGKSPFAPLEWLEGMKDKAPHWFPSTASGGGAGGGGSGGGSQIKGKVDGSPEERAAYFASKYPDLQKSP